MELAPHEDRVEGAHAVNAKASDHPQDEQEGERLEHLVRSRRGGLRQAGVRGRAGLGGGGRAHGGDEGAGQERRR